MCIDCYHATGAYNIPSCPCGKPKREKTTSLQSDGSMVTCRICKEPKIMNGAMAYSCRIVGPDGTVSRRSCNWFMCMDCAEFIDPDVADASNGLSRPRRKAKPPTKCYASRKPSCRCGKAKRQSYGSWAKVAKTRNGGIVLPYMSETCFCNI